MEAYQWTTITILYQVPAKTFVRNTHHKVLHSINITSITSINSITITSTSGPPADNIDAISAFIMNLFRTTTQWWRWKRSLGRHQPSAQWRWNKNVYTEIGATPVHTFPLRTSELWWSSWRTTITGTGTCWRRSSCPSPTWSSSTARRRSWRRCWSSASRWL